MSDVIHLNVIGESQIPLIPDDANLVPVSVEQVRTIWLNPDPYEGSYEVTPNQERQVLNTRHKTLNQNVVVNPIPPNYGLITYNGRTLTVS